MRIALVFAALVCLGLTPWCSAEPQVDYHQHFFSPEITKLAKGQDPITANEMIALLDQAGIRRALVISIAYPFSNPNQPQFENEYERVKGNLAPKDAWAAFRRLP